MKDKLTRRGSTASLGGHMRHNVVAYLALFFALSGSAIAAKPMITGADIQDGSITGADVQDDSLKGADVDESSLGAVPFATNAAKATDATTLGTLSLSQVRSGIDAATVDGKDATAFLGSKIALRVSTPQTGARLAECLPGEVATGGGGAAQTHNMALNMSAPPNFFGPPTTWNAEARVGESMAQTYVLCASTP